MTYCKDYCEEKGISTSKLTEAQRTLYYIAENMRLAESIAEEGYRHFQMAIKALEQGDVLDKIKGYIVHIRNTGMGKKKSLEFIEKFIEGLKMESESE